MHKFLSCSQNEGGKSLLESMRATSFRDVLKSCGSRFGIKTKKSQIALRLDFERKTRLELATPTLARLCSTN